MSQPEETFFTRVGCIDGRVQELVFQFGKEKFGARYPDTITEPGIVSLLANDPPQHLLEALKQKSEISLHKHLSREIVVHGHQECAANPVDDDIHREHVKKSVVVISDLVHEKVPVVGVFVRRSFTNSLEWEVDEIFERAAAV